MLGNYIKIALRNLREQKIYSVINITGLSLALAVSIFGILFVTHELSFNKFHQDHERIFRVVTAFGEGMRQQGKLSEIPSAAKTVLSDQPGAIEQMVRIKTYNVPVRRGTDSFNERIFFTEEEYLDIFSFDLIQGDISAALDQPSSAVISENMALKYFGEENPVGKHISVYLSAAYHDFQVTGVIEDAPRNSSIQHSFLLSYRWLANRNPDEYLNSWAPDVFSFVKIEDSPVSVEEAESAFNAVVKSAMAVYLEERGFSTSNGGSFKFESFSDMHLSTDVRNWPNTVLLGPPPSNILYSFILLSIAFVVLLIACINYTTWSIGYSTRRGKEVGVRKTLGAGRSQIMMQYWTETLLITFASVFLGLALLQMMLPPLNNILGIQLSLDILAGPGHLLVLAGLWISVSLLAGCYPSLLLSGFKPQRVLKGETKSNSGKVLSRYLLGVQYAGVLILIISLVTIIRQLDNIQSRSFGSEEDQVLLVKNQRDEETSYMTAYNRIQSELQALGYQDITASFGAVNDDLYMILYDLPDGAGNITARAFFTDYNYLDIYDDITLKSGRFFQESVSGDQRGAIVVNETFVREMGLENPVGTYIHTENISLHEDRVQIIGVVEDFHFESLHQPIAPAVFVPIGPNSSVRYISVRFPASETGRALQDVREVWANVYPGLPFDYSFLDQRYDAFYESEERWKNITTYATVLGMVISVMGIIALTGMAANNRRKEIGIRKIMGASVFRVIVLLGRQFLIALGVAFFVAAPVAWYLMNRWLQNFSYAIDIGVFPFLIAAGITLVVTMLAFTHQAMHAALENPVHSLRSDS